MGYAARVLRDSVSPDNVRLTTMEVTFPRCVLAEFNTHRTFSRNSASSRAIPIEKMLKRVLDDPFIPVYWGKNQKGMKAEQELSDDERWTADSKWLFARDSAVDHAKVLLDLGIHKQLTNRLLEPFLYHTVICTATDWSNFFALRCHPDAQPEIRKIAVMMKKLYDMSEPSPVNYGDWHLPLVEHDEALDLEVKGFDVKKVSVGRCARVSYLTHDGVRDPRADVELCDRLQRSGHMSPAEHAARPMTRDDAEAIFRKRGVAVLGTFNLDYNEVHSGNFKGWVSLRKTIKNEHDFSLMNKENV